MKNRAGGRELTGSSNATPTGDFTFVSPPDFVNLPHPLPANPLMNVLARIALTLALGTTCLTAADRPAPARQAGELTLARPINHTAVINPLESPIRSTPATPMRSTILRNKLLIGWPPNFR